jgi:hypothetical protein
MDVVKFLERYCAFEEGKAYVLMLIPRKKENGTNTEKDKLGLLQRRVITNMADARDALEYFDDFTARYPKIVFRVYITAEQRDLTKALFTLQEKLARMTRDLHYGNKEVFNRIVKLSSELKTTLCEKGCRAQKLFHFDVDYDNKCDDGHFEYVRLSQAIMAITGVEGILHMGKTLNGFAIITKPFNPLLLKEEYPDANGMNIVEDLVEIKTNSYLYLTVYNSK